MGANAVDKKPIFLVSLKIKARPSQPVLKAFNSTRLRHSMEPQLPAVEGGLHAAGCVNAAKLNLGQSGSWSHFLRRDSFFFFHVVVFISPQKIVLTLVIHGCDEYGEHARF